MLVALKEWAQREGAHPVTAYRWFREGKLPVPARRVGGLTPVEQSRGTARADDVARVTAWTTGQGIAVSRVVTEVGSALDGRRKEFLGLSHDPAVTTIVVEHRDRFPCFGADYVEAALAAQGRRLLVVDPVEVDDDLVRDVTEILASRCARLYGRRSGADRARRAIDAVTIGQDPR